MSGLLTFHDLVSHVLDVADIQGDDVDFRRAIRAAQWGFYQATTRHQWGSYDTEHVVTFNAAQNTGTVSITAGGVATITGATWPAWAAEGSLVISDDPYRVRTRDSDTQLTLEDWTGKAVTDSSYRLAHNRTILPHDVREVFDVWDQTNDYRLMPLKPEQFRDRDRWQIGTAGVPAYATVRRVMVNGANKSEFRITPFPSQAATINISYVRRPPQPAILYRTGLLSVGNGTGLVTLHSSMPPLMNVIGAWLRISTNEGATSAPLSSSVFSPAEAEWEGEIVSQSGSSSFTVSSAAPNVTNRGGLVTDVLDIPSFAMNAAKMYAEAQMARIQGTDLRKYEALEAMADRELRFAMEQDSQIVRPRVGYYARGENIAPIPYVDP